MFSDIATALCYDQRGSGHSDKSPPYDVATFVADLEALRQYWGFDRWVVGGHSWGANLVLAYALTHPGRCIGLLYVCGTGIDERWHGDYKKAQRAKLPAQEQLLLDRLEGQRTGLTATEAKANSQARWHLLRKTDFFDPETLAIALLAANAWQPLVPGIRDLPALFLHGEADTRPYWPSQALAKQMEHAKLSCFRTPVMRSSSNSWKLFGTTFEDSQEASLRDACVLAQLPVRPEALEGPTQRTPSYMRQPRG